MRGSELRVDPLGHLGNSPNDTEPKLTLLTAHYSLPQPLGDKWLGQRIMTFIRKLTDRDSRLVSQRTNFPHSKFQLLLYRGRGGGEAHWDANQWLSMTAYSRSLTATCLPYLYHNPRLAMSIPQSCEKMDNDLVTQHKPVCQTHSEAKQYQNIGVWNRERFIAGPCKETVAHALKSPNSPKAFSKSHLQER